MADVDTTEDTQRYRAGRRFFVYAPPLKGVRPSKRKPPNPPYKGAPAWKCSVYYYWWEYLRRHEGYRQCCAKGGKGEYAKLYADFGDVHAHDDFWLWWSKEGHSELFCEPTARKIRVLDEKSRFEPTLLTHLIHRIGRGRWARRLIRTMWRYGERVSCEQDDGSGRLRPAAR